MGEVIEDLADWSGDGCMRWDWIELDRMGWDATGWNAFKDFLLDIEHGAMTVGGEAHRAHTTVTLATTLRKYIS